MKPTIAVNVAPKLTNDEIASLAQSCHPSREFYDRCPGFNELLFEIVAGELDRRARRGELERTMTALPMPEPRDTAEWLLAANARRFAMPNALTEAVFDHVLALASLQLSRVVT
jgi:hypothetical protein